METKPETNPTRPARVPKPEWLKVKLPKGERYNRIKGQARQFKLHTVCEEARCPNIGECWQGGTATFMLLGQECTRGCRFCSVGTTTNPPPLDADEPAKVAETVKGMELDYVVLTTVDRDDLPDQGAGHIAQTIRRTQLAAPGIMIEVLIPDFRGEHHLLQQVTEAAPTVLAHNVETVRRLTRRVRDPRAGYDQSLEVLRQSKALAPAIYTKSSIMVGLGETDAEVEETMRDLRQAGCDFLTVGQYLQPEKRKLPVEAFIPPERFAEIEQEGLKMGFAYVASGPLVRSSYRAAEYYIGQTVQSGAAPHQPKAR